MGHRRYVLQGRLILRPTKGVNGEFVSAVPAAGPGCGFGLCPAGPGHGAQVPQHRGDRLRPGRGRHVRRLRVPEPESRWHAAASVDRAAARDTTVGDRPGSAPGVGHHTGLRDVARAGGVPAGLSAAAAGGATDQGVRLGGGDAGLPGHRRPEFRYDGAGGGTRPAQSPHQDREDRLSLRPDLPGRHRRGGRGRPGRRLQVHPIRPRHQGRGRERDRRGADRHLRDADRSQELDDRLASGHAVRRADHSDLLP